MLWMDLFLLYRDRTLFNIASDVIESSTYILFTSDLGGYPNPLVIDFGLSEWQVGSLFYYVLFLLIV